MPHSKVYRFKQKSTLKSLSYPKKETLHNSGTRVSFLRLEVLSHLLTTTFIANQLGLKVSLRLSKDVKKLLELQGQPL